MMILKKYKQNKFFKNKNALDLIPVKLVEYELLENGNARLLVKRFRFEFMNKLFKKSNYFHIKLDTQGSEVWKLIDGKLSIHEIVDNFTNQENLSERVVLFITDLYRKDLVDFKK